MNTDLLHKKVLGEKWRVYTTIDGNRCNPEQRVGYCWSETHRGYLTLNLMKEHQCIEKGCHHFQKYERSPYWQQKAKVKAEKKKSKEIQKFKDAQKDRILQTIRNLTADDADFFAVSVDKEAGTYIVRYIRFAWLDINSYVQRFKTACGVGIYLQEIKADHKTKLQILKNHHAAK